ncbi:hypothetical protein FBU30_001213 [Linnemannia zychae]|nr:hypothetical protein FBU30_001213 [Linnemannia zychae]
MRDCLMDDNEVGVALTTETCSNINTSNQATSVEHTEIASTIESPLEISNSPWLIWPSLKLVPS